MGIAIECVVILLLILVNGVFAMGEIALVSARRARLAVLERKGVPGAAMAPAARRGPAALSAHRAGRRHPGQRADRRVRRRADRWGPAGLR